jgi:Flp pilus assembly protein TadG
VIRSARHRWRRDRRGERAGTAGSLPPGRPAPYRGPSRPAPHDPRQRGQAAVELALVLPLLAILLLALVQVGLVVREQILVVHAAREAAREAAVDPSPDAARAAAVESSALDRSRLDLTITGRGGPGTRVQVTARYGPPSAVPLVGHVVSGLRLEASATMRVER